MSVSILFFVAAVLLVISIYFEKQVESERRESKKNRYKIYSKRNLHKLKHL